MHVKRTERGWGGHYCLAYRCLFRRNTLLEYGDVRLVVSSVGLQVESWASVQAGRTRFTPIGGDGKQFETMVFHARANDTRYHDADIARQVPIQDSQCAIYTEDADDLANIMHEEVVEEMTRRLLTGDVAPYPRDTYL